MRGEVNQKNLVDLVVVLNNRHFAVFKRHLHGLGILARDAHYIGDRQLLDLIIFMVEKRLQQLENFGKTFIIVHSVYRFFKQRNLRKGLMNLEFIVCNYKT